MNLRDLKVGQSQTIKASSFGLMLVKDDIEFVFNPFTALLQIGMGGEWWSGPVKEGKNLFHHKKEQGDPGYKPVGVFVQDKENKLTFRVSGGFYDKTVDFTLQLK